jgi:hypothetical protein
VCVFRGWWIWQDTVPCLLLFGFSFQILLRFVLCSLSLSRFFFSSLELSRTLSLSLSFLLLLCLSFFLLVSLSSFSWLVSCMFFCSFHSSHCVFLLLFVFFLWVGFFSPCCVVDAVVYFVSPITSIVLFDRRSPSFIFCVVFHLYIYMDGEDDTCQ